MKTNLTCVMGGAHTVYSADGPKYPKAGTATTVRSTHTGDQTAMEQTWATNVLG